jgi:hypothetical protein
MILETGFGFFKSTSVTKASTPPLSTEKYLVKNFRNGITNCGTRKIDRHIFYSRGEAKWLSC